MLVWKRIKQEINNWYLHVVSPAKARVIIAKDVIAQVKAGKILAEKGVYVQSTSLAVSGRPCKACAIGSLMIARVDRANRLPSMGLITAPVELLITDFFPLDMLRRIEVAFEQQSMIHFDEDDGTYSLTCLITDTDITTELFDEHVRVAEWSKVQLSSHADERLIQIMEIIIENRGEFVIP